MHLLRCPLCLGELEDDAGSLRCVQCRESYPVEDGIPRLVHDSVPGSRDKRRECAGWVALAKEQSWYEPDDDVDAHLPFLRELGWDSPVWDANAYSFRLLVDRYVHAGQRVLEVGAAKCWAANTLVPRGVEYVGTDILTDTNIGLGRGAFYEARVGTFLRVQADGERLPFADGAFDVVFCVAALHHALDLGAMVGEMARVARRGGVVAALNEGTRALRSNPDDPEQDEEKGYGINEHVHTLPAYVWAFVRAGLAPILLHRPDGYAEFTRAERTKISRLMKIPGGRLALTLALNLFGGYSAATLAARKSF
jgi:SAM-dependent methyltransferase